MGASATFSINHFSSSRRLLASQSFTEVYTSKYSKQINRNSQFGCSEYECGVPARFPGERAHPNILPTADMRLRPPV